MRRFKKYWILKVLRFTAEVSMHNDCESNLRRLMERNTKFCRNFLRGNATRRISGNSLCNSSYF